MAKLLAGIIIDTYIGISYLSLHTQKKIPMLEQEFQYYLDNQKELVDKYNGKFLIIHNKAVVGAYDTNIEAYIEGNKKFAAGSFLIQRCSPGKDDYTQTFHSRVSFA